MLETKTVIGVSDAKISNDPDDMLITYALGSCIAVCLYDPSTHIGGMLHYQLPNSRQDPERAKAKPFMFADTGMKILVEKLISIGANKKRLRIKIAGGAAMDNGAKGFEIGKRNYLAIREVTWKNGMFIDVEDVGGNLARNMYMNMADGSVSVRSNGFEKTL